MFKRLDMLTKDTSMKITLIAPALMVLALAACGQKEEAAAPVAAPAICGAGVFYCSSRHPKPVS
jgi:nitrous oxide reductase accessory protein NosL